VNEERGRKAEEEKEESVLKERRWLKEKIKNPKKIGLLI